MKFYKIDDQIVISDKSLSVGEELVTNTTDAAQEKHVPVVKVDGDTVSVCVGSVEHPMLEAHFIGWILLETEAGFQIHYLKPGMKPEAKFKVTEKVVAAYEYCNLHGLWKATV
ncbi:desulfoferrodoxin family protein [Oribacterium sp. FC2011]|uniref:desulfoferrodoxin family protein n=1 Tax=Oribacterium sp. FC2011 TaxID=1408311 RepID=UPI0004E13D54|nr:desulfoferrodoxin family protein [Oribacterium sp. FC2011]